MTTSQKKLIPQAEEFFVDAAWFPIYVAITMLEYDTDQDIVAKAREKLTGEKAPIKKAGTRARNSRQPRILT